MYMLVKIEEAMYGLNSVLSREFSILRKFPAEWDLNRLIRCGHLKGIFIDLDEL